MITKKELDNFKQLYKVKFVVIHKGQILETFEDYLKAQQWIDKFYFDEKLNKETIKKIKQAHLFFKTKMVIEALERQGYVFIDLVEGKGFWDFIGNL